MQMISQHLDIVITATLIIGNVFRKRRALVAAFSCPTWKVLVITVLLAATVVATPDVAPAASASPPPPE